MSKQKLELTWIGKENPPKLEPRILLEDPEKSYHAPHRVSDHDIFDNRVISGDNLLALKALEQDFAGKVKCIYIDPPYNTGTAYEHYDDGLEHSIWLTLMGARLELLWAFETPKPERLMQRILTIATNPGDLVLDSFAGSGTTGAVAHKMGRRWIMAELGEHYHTHIMPRLKKVVDGTDPGGITEAVNWKGGGGFRYYRLATSLLEKDKWGNWVISKEFNAAMLAEAVCKLEGFVYAPSDTVYWQHGQSTERDFIYVTTANLTHAQLQQLSDEVGSGRSLLVVCSAFRGRKDGYGNLTVKKIPKAVLSRCEWGKDDYSLNVENLPKAAPPKGQMDLLSANGGKQQQSTLESDERPEAR